MTRAKFEEAFPRGLTALVLVPCLFVGSLSAEEIAAPACGQAMGEDFYRSDAPFPEVGCVKGLQVQMTDDAISLGIRHAAINVSLGALLRTGPGPGAERIEADGTERFVSLRYAEHLDRQIKPLSDAGIVVYLILLAYPTGDAAKDQALLHPDAPDGGYTIAGFDATTESGRATYAALIAFLAERYGGAHPERGRVWGWIVGNEVNSQGQWYALGDQSLDDAASEYERAVRLTHETVRRFTPHARCYLSFDHHWNVRAPGMSELRAYPGRAFLEAFARIARERGDFAWHVAYHPYPDDLGDPRTWLDRKAWPTDDSPHVTFKNLEVLSAWLDRPELRFEDRPRRIILSEQGIHCRKTPDGETLQAAGFAYAWEAVARQPGIDALIWHRHVDHAEEGGLRLGLYENEPGSIATPGRRRRIYDLFRAAGTPEWKSASAFASEIVGLESWNGPVP